MAQSTSGSLPLGPSLTPEPNGEGDAVAARRELRLAIARHDAAPILLWAGTLVVVFSLISYAIDSTGGFVTHSLDITVGLVFIVVGLLLPRLPIPNAGVPWLTGLLITALVVALLIEEWQSPSAVAMAYILLIMVAFPPSILAWPPFVTGGVIMVIGFVITARRWTGNSAMDWAVAAVAAALIGAVLLRTRLRSIDALADVTSLAGRLATTDALTGLLNRRGLELQVPNLTANARRHGKPVFVAFVDVDGLKAANDGYGHEFGDQVITAVATAVLGAVRQGDLVARWGGDEILVAGIGTVPNEAQFSDRLHSAIQTSGIDPNAWPGTVSIGLAAAEVLGDDIDPVIKAADLDMYERRHRAR